MPSAHILPDHPRRHHLPPGPQPRVRLIVRQHEPAHILPARPATRPNDGFIAIDRDGPEAAEHAYKELAYKLYGNYTKEALLWAAYFGRESVDAIHALTACRTQLSRSDVLDEYSPGSFDEAMKAVRKTMFVGPDSLRTMIAEARWLAWDKEDQVLIKKLTRFECESHEYHDPVTALLAILVGLTPDKQLLASK